MKNNILIIAGLILTTLLTQSVVAGTEENIESTELKIEQTTQAIKAANKAKDKEQANSLREQREQLKAELRTLNQREKDEKREQDKIKKRAAAESEWETYPNDRKLCTAIQYNRPDLVKKVLNTNQLDLTQPIG